MGDKNAFMASKACYNVYSLISAIKDAAENAADFDAFKTAIAKLGEEPTEESSTSTSTSTSSAA